MEFVAIDFETASHQPNSACQLAAVKVRDGAIVEEHCWLIRPPGLRFSPHCIAVHGILPEQVKNEPSFEKIWDKVAPIIDGQIVVAHNARFDIGVLVACLATYDIACPEIEYSCTRLIARRCWPGRAGYGLKPTAASLGIDFRHHDALEDSRACAEIALAAGRVQNAAQFSVLENSLRISRGTVRLGSIAGPRALTRPGQQTKSRSSLTTTIDNAYQAGGWPKTNVTVSSQLNVEKVLSASRGTRPLEGRIIVFSGKILGMEIRDMARLVEQLGAQCDSAVTPQTDYLVLGSGGAAEVLASQKVAQASNIAAAQTTNSGCQETPAQSPTQNLIAESTAEYETDRNKPNRNDAAPNAPAAMDLHTNSGTHLAITQAKPNQSRNKPTRVLSERQFLALLPGGSAAVQTSLTKRAK